jgi:hypothetical protein
MLYHRTPTPGSNFTLLQRSWICALHQANVIGITTSGLSRNLKLLCGVSAKVLICEEAGKVFEVHMLTTLLVTICKVAYPSVIISNFAHRYNNLTYRQRAMVVANTR